MLSIAPVHLDYLFYEEMDMVSRLFQLGSMLYEAQVPEQKCPH